LTEEEILSGWGKYQRVQEMETNRKYEYDDEFLPVLHEWLGVKPGMTIVDVGCGSGYFTRILARALQGKGRVVGIDADQSLISGATRIARDKKLSNVVEFEKGNIFAIPLPDNFSDLVTCHVVLCNIPHQLEAIVEMRRIVKEGGTVATLEPARGGGKYCPDERLNELFVEFTKAFDTTINKEWREKQDMSGFIGDIHLRLPGLFMRAGLKNITLHGYLSTFLLCDPRHSIKEMQKHVQAKLSLWKKLEKRNRNCALFGGMSEEEFEELFRRYATYLNELVEKPVKITETPEVEIVSRVIITGRK
jgi:ubiquinone/menaquinone biosynthesis C-methylase UbiE